MEKACQNREKQSVLGAFAERTKTGHHRLTPGLNRTIPHRVSLRVELDQTGMVVAIKFLTTNASATYVLASTGSTTMKAAEKKAKDFRRNALFMTVMGGLALAILTIGSPNGLLSIVA